MKMSSMNAILLFTLVTTIMYILYIVSDGERYMTSLMTLIENYKLKPLNRSSRIVVVIPCVDKVLDANTLKSILSQSVRVHDIAIETKFPVSDEWKQVVSVHEPDTTRIRERDATTMIINVENEKWYPYDFIESKLT